MSNQKQASQLISPPHIMNSNFMSMTMQNVSQVPKDSNEIQEYTPFKVKYSQGKPSKFFQILIFNVITLS